jgi:5-methylcytosine-specific restriction protein A
MNRSTRLVRRTPLTATTGLSRTPKQPSDPFGKRRSKTGPTNEVREIVRRRAQGWCEYCRTSAGLDVHHRRPRAMGGTADPAANRPPNLVYLCRACHGWLESHRELALATGWLVPQGNDPAAVKVVMGAATVMLTDRGTYVTVEVI